MELSKNVQKDFPGPEKDLKKRGKEHRGPTKKLRHPGGFQGESSISISGGMSKVKVEGIACVVKVTFPETNSSHLKI